MLLLPSLWVPTASAWYDETHLAVARAAGDPKWFNAAGADMLKLKAEAVEKANHYVNNPPGTVITPATVLAQVPRYNQPDAGGHLYGAILAALRDYIRERHEGKYGRYHLAFCAHYVGDLSHPLHNQLYNSYNQTHHRDMEATANRAIKKKQIAIKLTPLTIRSESDLAQEVARIANLTIQLGARLESANRLLTPEEISRQLGLSASLLKAIFDYAGRMAPIDDNSVAPE